MPDEIYLSEDVSCLEVAVTNLNNNPQLPGIFLSREDIERIAEDIDLLAGCLRGEVEDLENSTYEKPSSICAECRRMMGEGYADIISSVKIVEVEEIRIIRRYIPEKLREKIYARDGYKCKHCGKTENLTMDHVRAFSKGGRATEKNLQTLCQSCNSRKGAR